MSKDTILIGGNSAGRNFGQEPFIALIRGTRKALLEFDLSGTAARSDVAYTYMLRLFVTYVATDAVRSVQVSCVGQDYDWNERSVTWDSFGEPETRPMGWFSVFNTDRNAPKKIPLGNFNSTANNGKMILILETMGEEGEGDMSEKFDFRTKEFRGDSAEGTAPKLIAIPQLSG